MSLLHKYIVLLTASSAALLTVSGAVAAENPAAGQTASSGLASGQAAPVSAQAAGRIDMDGVFLEPLQQRDSVLIADQLEYGFSLDGVEEGTGFAFPDYSKGFCEGVEVISPWKIDTLEVHKGRKGRPSLMDIKASVTVTSFEEGEYVLPPVAVIRHTPEGAVDTIVFGSRTLQVKTMPVDTATFQLHDIKGQEKYPVTFSEVLPYLAGVILLAALVVLVVWLVRKYGRKGAGDNVRKDPPHVVALRKLDSLRGNRLWAPEKQKAFYSGVTDALREYIVSRYGISAMEMTTAEIFSDLSEKNVPEDLYAEIKALFERADYVKFAKYVATDQENASAVPSAVKFVTMTYQQEVDKDNMAQGQPAAPEDRITASGGQDPATSDPASSAGPLKDTKKEE